MVIGRRLGNGRHNRDPVPLGADIVRRRHNRNVNIILAADLALGNNQLSRVRVARVCQRVLQDADGPQYVSHNLDLVGEVARVANDDLGLGLKLHLGLDVGHGGLDADRLVALVDHLVDVGVEHVGAAVNGRQAGETLGELAEAVEGVDVGRLSVAGDRVAIQTNALDGLGGDAGLVEIRVGLVESHGVADEVFGRGLEAELIKHLLHGAGGHVEAWGELSLLVSQNVLHHRIFVPPCDHN